MLSDCPVRISVNLIGLPEGRIRLSNSPARSHMALSGSQEGPIRGLDGTVSLSYGPARSHNIWPYHALSGFQMALPNAHERTLSTGPIRFLGTCQDHRITDGSINLSVLRGLIADY